MKAVAKTIETPLGEVRLVSTAGALTGLYLPGQEEGPEPGARDGADPVLEEAARQVEEYFAGSRKAFDVPLRLEGTPFQKEVWRALLEIPFGATRSYGDVARAIGRPSACRAVGGANGRNPVSIIVPCHRVIGRDGSLTGYGGGPRLKCWLLEHEAGQRG